MVEGALEKVVDTVTLTVADLEVLLEVDLVADLEVEVAMVVAMAAECSHATTRDCRQQRHAVIRRSSTNGDGRLGGRYNEHPTCLWAVVRTGEVRLAGTAVLMFVAPVQKDGTARAQSLHRS